MLTNAETDIVTNMERTARKWHDGQFRKDGKTPYIEHPKAVVEQLMAWGFTKESNLLVLAIAWGHDLGEDDLREDSPLRASEVLRRLAKRHIHLPQLG